MTKPASKPTKGRVPQRQPKRTFNQLLASLKSGAFKRPASSPATPFMAFLRSVRDSITDRKALHLPGDIQYFWYPLVMNGGDDKKAWAYYRAHEQAKPCNKFKVVQAENGVIRREVFQLRLDCEELEKKIAALKAERGC